MEDMLYKFPDKNLLIKNNNNNEIDCDIEKEKIEKFFQNYKIDIECKEVYVGLNSITYIIDLKYKTRVNTIKSFKDDLMLTFNVIDVEFKVAINETPYLGIELINNKNEILMLGDLIESEKFNRSNYKVPIIIGKDFSGKTIIEDLVELPHLLIAGTTGTGKSNFLATLILDILYKFAPNEVSLVLIDTRATNFQRFNGIPHLLIPVVTDSKKSIGLIAWLIQEMSNRYRLFYEKNVDNIDIYNKVSDVKLPRIIVIIEDFCDLMMDTGKEIEVYIRKLIQMSRASGIHVVISTQRPSTDVLTGLIKTNIPSRIAFKVTSQVDSKIILDVVGAEKLLSHGDIIFSKLSDTKNRRIQTPYISDEEIQKIVEFLKEDKKAMYSEKNLEVIENIDKTEKELVQENDKTDPFLMEAIDAVIEEGEASTSFIQRKFKLGYARSGRIIDQMEERGIVSGYRGSKPREVLISLDEWKKIKNK